MIATNKDSAAPSVPRKSFASASQNESKVAALQESDPGSSSTILAGLEPVNQEDVVEALNSLLTRIGLPPSIQEKNLLSRIIELENHNKHLQSEVASESKLLNEAKEAVTKAKSANQCPICLSEEVSFVMVPCGHALCRSCMGSLQGNKCPYCRKVIQQKIRFYMSNGDDED